METLNSTEFYDRLARAMESALAAGCSDEAAVRYLLTVEGENRPAPEALEVGWLDRYQHPLPVMKEYDELLAAEVAR